MNSRKRLPKDPLSRVPLQVSASCEDSTVSIRSTDGYLAVLTVGESLDLGMCLIRNALYADQQMATAIKGIVGVSQ